MPESGQGIAIGWGVDERKWHAAIDRFLVEAFGFVAWVAGQIWGAAASLWAMMPFDWHPAIKAAVFLLGVIIALRLIRMTTGAVRYGLGWPVRVINLWFLKLRSPFGRSAWASLSMMRAAGMTKRGGLFLGQWRGWFRRADLFRHGDGHILTIAAPGSGKTTSLVIPALLEAGEGSFIVIDPKAQLAAMTARHRATKGPVIYLNPFAEELAEQTGSPLPDSGFNPLSVLSKGYNLKDDAENLARLLMVTDRRDSGSYWNDEAAGLLAVFMVWQILREPKANQTLTFLWGMVREDPEAIEQRLMWMQGVKESRYLQAEATKLIGLTKVAPQWQGVISKAQLATQRYAPDTPLGDHTARDGLDLGRLKRENVTVFLMIPTGRIKVAGPWLNLVMGAIGVAIGRPGRARPVYMLIDEAPALGFLPDLRNWLRESREAGLRAWLFSQTRAALAADDLYGENGFADIMGLCETRSFFNVGESILANEISAMLGEKTEANRSTRDGSGNDNISVVGVPLMRPEEILRMKSGRQLIVRTGGMNPIRARLVPYWTRKGWSALVDPNPYRMP